MKGSLHRRLMTAFAVFTLAVTALFAFFAMAFVYAIEDRFLARILTQEAQAQHAHHRQHGRWIPPQSPHVTLHVSAATLPGDLSAALTREPRRSEFAGEAGRHYHVLSLVERGQAPWLVAEVSPLLIVRPMRESLLTWLAWPRA